MTIYFYLFSPLLCFVCVIECFSLCVCSRVCHVRYTCPPYVRLSIVTLWPLAKTYIYSLSKQRNTDIASVCRCITTQEGKVQLRISSIRFIKFDLEICGGDDALSFRVVGLEQGVVWKAGMWVSVFIFSRFALYPSLSLSIVRYISLPLRVWQFI